MTSVGVILIYSKRFKKLLAHTQDGMMPAPALKTSELMQAVLAVDGKTSREGDFSVRKLRKEVDSVRKYEPATAYMLDGILSARLREYSNSRKAHEASVKLAPSDDTLLWNYSASMTSFARYHEALPLVQRLVDMGYGNLDYLKSLLWLSLVSLDIESLKDSLVKIQRFNHDLVKILEGTDMESSYMTFQQYIADFPSVEKDLKRVFAHVQSVLEEQSHVAVRLDIRENEFYKQRVLHLQYLVESDDNSNVLALNDALLQKVSSDESIQCWDTLIPTFVFSEKIGDEGVVEYAHNG